jgi:osmotically inducible lipoprotein OsmB
VQAQISFGQGDFNSLKRLTERKDPMKRMAIFLAALVIIFALPGCYGMSREQQTTLSGAAIGAGGGALLGGIVGGRPLEGAALGAALGALGGYIVGEQGEGYRHHRR